VIFEHHEHGLFERLRRVLEPSAGTVSFCVDHTGTAKVSVATLTPKGIFSEANRTQTAFVVGAHKETRAQTAMRQNEQNARIAADNAEQARKNQESTDKIARVCSSCSARWNGCTGARLSRYKCDDEYRSCVFQGLVTGTGVCPNL
jgi:hypothetical protein